MPDATTLKEHLPETGKLVALPRIEGLNCFACGSANPIGLKMTFSTDGEKVFSFLALTQHHVGWEHIAHGGIVSTLLDEAMGWAVLAFIRKFGVTRNLSVRYLRPVQVGRTLTVTAKISCQDEKGCQAVAELFDEDSKRSATASAQIAFLSQKRLAAIPEPLLSGTLNAFAQMEAFMARFGK
jgi:uncharacterized protein (TIGR00369 family)